MIAIIDYGAGNLKSVENAFRTMGVETICTSDNDMILDAERVILPGVGAFGDAMGRIRAAGLDEVITEVISKGTPFLGICLGLQLLFDESEESPGVEGLSILRGKIRRLPEGDGRKIPQIGWNRLDFHGNGRLFEGCEHDQIEPYAYFVHSYYLEAADESIVTATCDYGVRVHASIESGNVFACQFHPEKSGEFGLGILRRFTDIG